jgi:N-acetyl-gamma-glutamyl-phosphate/LysW-gamma-L-alpha-aminoadipyl-6-phosphate reductase
MSLKVVILGAGGYAGGELLRILDSHPGVEIIQITSNSHAGKYVHAAHPNLRGNSSLKFSGHNDLLSADIVFCCLPHGEAAKRMSELMNQFEYIVDLSSDYRLSDPRSYNRWYGSDHPTPDLLEKFCYGLPEINREQLKSARYVSGVGCNATAVNLALLPFQDSSLVTKAVVDLKVGSSEGGASPNKSSHHPERSGAVRSFSPCGHRHQAEILQLYPEIELHFSVTSVELVRGVLATCHLFLSEKLTEKDIWQLFRPLFKKEPFLRLVKERSGIHRYPEPKILAGSNYCDIGFAVDPESNRVVVLSALDNLVKGAAGTAVQCMNLMTGHDETEGLTFSGLHPA